MPRPRISRTSSPGQHHPWHPDPHREHAQPFSRCFRRTSGWDFLALNALVTLARPRVRQASLSRSRSTHRAAGRQAETACGQGAHQIAQLCRPEWLIAGKTAGRDVERRARAVPREDPRRTHVVGVAIVEGDSDGVGRKCRSGAQHPHRVFEPQDRIRTRQIRHVPLEIRRLKMQSAISVLESLRATDHVVHAGSASCLLGRTRRRRRSRRCGAACSSPAAQQTRAWTAISCLAMRCSCVHAAGSRVRAAKPLPQHRLTSSQAAE